MTNRALSYMEFIPEDAVVEGAMQLIDKEPTKKQLELAYLIARQENAIAHGVRKAKIQIVALEEEMMRLGGKEPECFRRTLEVNKIIRLVGIVHLLIRDNVDPNYTLRN